MAHTMENAYFRFLKVAAELAIIITSLILMILYKEVLLSKIILAIASYSNMTLFKDNVYLYNTCSLIPVPLLFFWCMLGMD